MNFVVQVQKMVLEKSVDSMIKLYSNPEGSKVTLLISVGQNNRAHVPRFNTLHK